MADNEIKFTLAQDERLIRTLRYQDISSGGETSSATIYLTNKRLIHSYTSTIKKFESRMVEEMPVSLIDSIESSYEQSRKPVNIGSVILGILVFLAGIALQIFLFGKMHRGDFLDYVGYVIAAVGVLFVILAFALRKKTYAFIFKAISYSRDRQHLQLGVSDLNPRKAKKVEENNKNRGNDAPPTSITIDGEEVKKFIDEIGALILNMKAEEEQGEIEEDDFDEEFDEDIFDEDEPEEEDEEEPDEEESDEEEETEEDEEEVAEA